MKKNRLGVVGLGPRGRFLYSLAAEKFPDVVNPVAACDIAPERWNNPHDFPTKEPLSMSRRFPDTIFYDDYETMLKEANLDAVLIETPADNHAEFCMIALEKGVAVLSDIPSVDSLEEAAMLWDAANQSSAIFMSGANPNEWGFVEALVDLWKHGLLGKPYYLDAEYIHDIRSYFDTSPWRRTYKPIRYCTHSLGPLLRILEEDLRTVSCVSTGAHILGEDNQHDLMTAHFKTESGIVVRFTASFINNAHIGQHSYRVFGTEGYFERFSGRGSIAPATFFSSNNLYGASKLTQLPIDTMRIEKELSSDSSHGGADFAMLHHFFKALAGECEPTTLREGLRITLPGIYAAMSAEQGGMPITIKYPWDDNFN